MKLIYIICFVLAVLLNIACHKNETTVDLDSKRALLVNKKWLIQSNISFDSANRETDLFSTLENYKKDDYLVFNSDSSYELNDNIILHSDSTTKILDSGSWLLSNDSMLMRHSDMFEHDFEPAVIKTISSTTFILETYFPSDRSTIRTSYISLP